MASNFICNYNNLMTKRLVICQVNVVLVSLCGHFVAVLFCGRSLDVYVAAADRRLLHHSTPVCSRPRHRYRTEVSAACCPLVSHFEYIDCRAYLGMSQYVLNAVPLPVGGSGPHRIGPTCFIGPTKSTQSCIPPGRLIEYQLRLG